MVGSSRRRPVSRWAWDADNGDAAGTGWEQDPGKGVRPRVPGGTETVLVVEDEPEVLDAAEAILKRLGYTVLVARDAEEALRRAGELEAPLDLLLTDVILPSRSGLAVAEALRDRWPSLPVLYMSAFTSDHVVPTVEGVPASQVFLQKPFSLEELARKIREALDTRKG